MKRIHRFNPPFYFGVAIVLMIGLDWTLPVSRIIVFPWTMIGLVFLIIGGLLNVVADQSFKRHETTVKPGEKPDALVTAGVYRVSRNPMYLGMVQLLLGLALLLGSLTPFLVVIVFAVFMDLAYITFEEKKLEATFGDIWRDYRDQVRRWI